LATTPVVTAPWYHATTASSVVWSNAAAPAARRGLARTPAAQPTDTSKPPMLASSLAARRTGT